jgi:hypothetical protein
MLHNQLHRLTPTQSTTLTDHEFDLLAQELVQLSERVKELKAQERLLKDKLIALLHNKPKATPNYVFTYTIRKGSIDYKLVPELKGVDLEPYRKAEVTQWTLQSIRVK